MCCKGAERTTALVVISECTSSCIVPRELPTVFTPCLSILRLNEDHTQLTWDSKTGETFKGAFKVSGPGVENPFFKRSKAPLECCITLSNKDRQLHLEFEDGETAMEMKEGFQVLVTHTNYAGMKKEVASAATAHGSDKEGEAQTSTNEE